MSKWFWIILTIVVGLLIGIFVLTNRGPDASLTPSDDPNEIVADDHIRGTADAPVTLVEYGDFQCPACKAAFPLVQQLSQDFPTQLKLVFRHFPLSSIHPNAFASARAAEAAAAQGKFFEMHDLLYEKQDEWSSSPSAANLFKDYATQLGLDMDKFNQDYNSSATTERINRDVKIGQSLDVTATPSFYLNGEKLDPNPRNYQEFKAKIEAALKQP